MPLMLNAPNTFLPWWTKRELKGWLEELQHRKRAGYEAAPTRKQVKKELRLRRRGSRMLRPS